MNSVGAVTDFAAPHKARLSLESVVAFVAAATFLLAAVLYTSHGRRIEQTDFTLTYMAGRIVHDGRGASLYDVAEQERMRTALFQRANPLVYEHPPFEALMFAPLSTLDYQTAYMVWGLLNATVWLCLPYLLRPYAPVPREPLGYLALWFLFAPLAVALFQGQSSLVLLLLYALCYISLKNQRSFLAGFLLGCGLFKFQFVLPFALIFLLRKQWKFLAGFAFSGVLLGLVSLRAVGWHGIIGYARLLLNVTQHPRNAHMGAAVDMPTLRGFVYALLSGRVAPGVLSSTVAILSIGVIVFVARRWPPGKDGNTDALFDRMFAASIAVSLMTGFHMFTHDFSPLMLAVLLAAAHLPPAGLQRRTLIASMVIFFCPFVYFPLVAWHSLYLMFVVLLAFMLLTATNVSQTKRRAILND